MLFLGILVTHCTRFGRNVYAIGGSEPSARMMGVPIGSTKNCSLRLEWVLRGAGWGGFTFYTGSGNPAFGVGFELDVIASVVIGGTLLTGGVGTHCSARWPGC